jgi:hypothetical protein
MMIRLRRPLINSSGRASPHRHYPPAKATPFQFSLTPFLTQHKAGRVRFRFRFRFRSARVGWPAFWRNPVCVEKSIGDRAVSSGTVLVIGVEQQFFGGDAVRFSEPPYTQADRLKIFQNFIILEGVELALRK